LFISVIIPTFNEAGSVGSLLSFLEKEGGGLVGEVIVVDGGSSDATVALAQSAGARVLESPRKGRAAQMNFGAGAAKGQVLYFLHADTFPSPGFAEQIVKAIKDGIGSGCFRLRFDLHHWFLEVNAWFSRFHTTWFRFGDQSLFVSRDLFHKAGSFREDHIIMEDHEIIRRLCRLGPFRVLPGSVTTSARKYVENGVFRTQGIYYVLFALYWLGMSQQRLVKTYRRLIRQDKI
jgi:rSAM/selenodomain-associated transferase 2